MEGIILSSLAKVFSDEKPCAKELERFSMLKNEKSSFQLAVFSKNDVEARLEIAGIGKEHYRAYIVRNVPAGLACNDYSDDYFLRRESGNYPDALEKIGDSVLLKGGAWQSIWVELRPENELSGNIEISVSLLSGGEVMVCKKVEAEIINAQLPKQSTVDTNWYHCDGVCSYFGVKPMSEEFWRINRSFIKTAVDNGINMILTPLFTPPLDTAVGGERLTVQLVRVKASGGKYRFDFRNLNRWVDMCLECGVEYFEMSHLFTQWGAGHAPKIVAECRKGRQKKIFGWQTPTKSKKYDDFLKQLSCALIKYIDGKGIRERCYFHISDEPGMKHLSNYMRRAKFMYSLFPGFKFIDALSDYEFYESGAVKIPVCNDASIDDFAGRVPELWTYYCCGNSTDYVPNRLFAMPSQRNRVLGYLIYAYGLKGFLQWGYNFYNTCYSLKSINPYEVTDAGGAFPAGDAFVVYPGEGGECVPSLRLLVFNDAMQDVRALQLLESKIGRDKALEVLQAGLKNPLKFSDYPRSDEWQLETRERINAEIKKIF